MQRRRRLGRARRAPQRPCALCVRVRRARGLSTPWRACLVCARGSAGAGACSAHADGGLAFRLPCLTSRLPALCASRAGVLSLRSHARQPCRPCPRPHVPRHAARAAAAGAAAAHERGRERAGPRELAGPAVLGARGGEPWGGSAGGRLGRRVRVLLVGEREGVGAWLLAGGLCVLWGKQGGGLLTLAPTVRAAASLPPLSTAQARVGRCRHGQPGLARFGGAHPGHLHGQPSAACARGSHGPRL